MQKSILTLQWEILMSIKKRKILAVTGARSEYDIISPVLFALSAREDVELGIIVTGSHLSETFGYSVKEIENDGFNIVARVYNLINSNRKIGRILSLGNQIAPLAHIFDEWKPDIVLVAGDREEAISVSMTAAFMDIPVAHIAGGDIAKDGNIDNSIRYATSKFAHIHFTILENHKENLLKLGEDDWRIFNYGNPALDKFLSTPVLSVNELETKTGFKLDGGNYGLLIYHPIITQVDEERKNIELIINSLRKTGMKFIVNSPNSDAGYASILDHYSSLKNDSQFEFFSNLDRICYINLMRNAKILVGNSSSGIIEAPSLALPVINIGPRQKSRLNAGNVIFTDYNMENIYNSIQDCSNQNFKEKLKTLKNPYGDGNSALKIAGKLIDLEINSTLIHKNITY